jgi:hypothetical protein
VNQLLILLTESLVAEPSYICATWEDFSAKERGASKPDYKTENKLKLHLQNIQDDEE